MSTSVLLAMLLAVVAWLVAGSTAVRSVSRIWLRHWVEQRLHGSVAAEVYLERPQRLLLAAGTGVALAVFLGGLLIGARTPSVPATIGMVVSASIVVLLVGQIMPRAIARRWAPALIPVLLPALRVFDVVVSPIHALAARIVRRRRAPGAPPEPERDSIEELLREGELEGVGERDEIAIITGVVEFGSKRVAEVMTPRAEIFAVDRALPTDALARRIARAEYSRVPVYEGTLDHVVGMVHVFDVLKAGAESLPRLRPVALTGVDRPCNELLFEMLRKRLHLAIVRDEGGQTVGLVTLEDLLEELVGDIRDEHDEPHSGQHASPPGAVTRAAGERPPTTA